MRILHVIDSGGVYGAETMLLGLMGEQREIGLEVALCSLGQKNIAEKPLEREALSRGFDVRKIRVPNRPSISGAFRIIRLAREGGFDVIHSHGYKGNILLGFVPSKVRKIPVIATLHGWTSTSILSKMRLYEWVDTLSLRFIDQVVLVSAGMLTNPRLSERIGKHAVVINNGITTSAETVSLSPEDPIAAFCTAGFIIGSIGRLSLEKGYRLLIDALHFLRAQDVPAKLVIIGEGPERRPLERRIKELGLQSDVLLAGYRESASRYVPFFDTFVLPSVTEGLPMTLLEAMLAGVPVIATEVGGVPSVLGWGRAGILVKPCDSQALCSAILKLYESPALGKQLSEEASSTVSLKYSARTTAREYSSVYEKVMNVK